MHCKLTMTAAWLTCGLLFSISHAQPLPETPQEDGEEFVDLLAGGDLSEHFQTTGNWTLSEDGVVHLQPRPGETGWQRYDAYLWLKTPYKDFECEFEYKHNAGGNSGFYFNVANRKQPVTTGIEVQILDSAGTERALQAHDCGGILPGFAPKENTTKSAGEWNYLHVTSVGGEVTVKLNGKLVNQAKLDDPKLNKLPKEGAIGFQDHGLPFWLRNVRIKAVPPSDDEGWVSLFNDKDLDGWIQRNGTAKYRVENETVVGTTAEGSPNSFLCTQNDYGDFELLFEVKVDDKLNSGVQLRSKSKPEYHNGLVHGPQVEIEAAPGAAGYIYSEGTGLGWVSQNRDKNHLFENGEWNAYRVRAVGPHIQTWVNGEPGANIIDETSSRSGFIGLQVHSIPRGEGPYEVRWRNIRIKELEADAAMPSGVIQLCVETWPADGKLARPDGVGNITAAYFAHDPQRTPIVVEFNTDATVVLLHATPTPPQPGCVTIVLETAEQSTKYADGRIVFSALDAKVVGSRAQLETHPGNHRIGFWNNADDYAAWDQVAVPEGKYDVELTYSTGSWYKYTTMFVGQLDLAKTRKHQLTVKCTKKVGDFVINLKAVTLRPAAKPSDASTQSSAAVAPNIVYVLVDDLGYGDVSCLNPKGKIPTPNMDRVAKEGMIYTSDNGAPPGEVLSDDSEVVKELGLLLTKAYH